ncbi:MAG TPA: hypothetical protein VGA91_05215 [Candidatus Limnocylindria bacterium]
MDGYSVNEAAAVLGIPEGRVWELLARGVLAGSTEVGGDMRVILRGSAVPEAVTPAPAANGGHGTQGGTNGGSNGGELSAFRELLTEFRNLTERYGQALLALGEARGEVASLRGRVELLEARVELRLPRVEAPMAAWEAGPSSEPDPQAAREPMPEPDLEAAVEPTPEPDLEAAREPMPEPDTQAAVEPMPEPDTQAAVEPMPELPEPEVAAPEASATEEAPLEPADATSAEPSSPPPAAATRKPKRRTRRARSSRPKASRPAPRSRSRLAVSGFAEALARAEDPTTAEVFTGDAPLPGADEAAEALAAYNQELATPVMEPPASEESVMEAPATEAPVPVTMPVFVRPGYTTETPEPDWIAEEDLVVPVSRVAPTGDKTERAGSALAVAEREADVDEQPTMDEEAAHDEESTAEPEARVEEVAEAAEVVAAVDATEDVEVESDEADETVQGPTASAKHGTLGMPVTADEWAGPEADMVPEPASDVEVKPEIAAESPGLDDHALLDALDRFSEPPSIPREPAFWEPEGRSRAPFAIPNLEGWEPAEIEALRAELRRFGTAAIPPTVAVGPASVTPPVVAPLPDAAPPSAAAPPPAPRPSPSVPPAPPRRPRGPAARAVRRLRRLLG